MWIGCQLTNTERYLSHKEVWTLYWRLGFSSAFWTANEERVGLRFGARSTHIYAHSSILDGSIMFTCLSEVCLAFMPCFLSTWPCCCILFSPSQLRKPYVSSGCPRTYSASMTRLRCRSSRASFHMRRHVVYFPWILAVSFSRTASERAMSSHPSATWTTPLCPRSTHVHLTSPHFMRQEGNRPSRCIAVPRTLAQTPQLERQGGNRPL